MAERPPKRERPPQQPEHEEAEVESQEPNTEGTPVEPSPEDEAERQQTLERLNTQYRSTRSSNGAPQVAHPAAPKPAKSGKAQKQSLGGRIRGFASGFFGWAVFWFWHIPKAIAVRLAKGVGEAYSGKGGGHGGGHASSSSKTGGGGHH